MVRTKADSTGVKASGAKAPRKVTVSTPTRSYDSSDSKGKPSGGGNAYHPRETPEWQKPITTFFAAPPSSSKGADGDSEVTSDKTSAEDS